MGNTATRATRATLDIGQGKPAAAAGVRSAHASAPSARAITAAAKRARRRASAARPSKGTANQEQCSRPGSCLRCRGQAQAEVTAAHGSGVTVSAAARVNAQPAGRERRRRVASQTIRRSDACSSSRPARSFRQGFGSRVTSPQTATTARFCHWWRALGRARASGRGAQPRTSPGPGSSSWAHRAGLKHALVCCNTHVRASITLPHSARARGLACGRPGHHQRPRRTHGPRRSTAGNSSSHSHQTREANRVGRGPQPCAASRLVNGINGTLRRGCADTETYRLVPYVPG